MRVVEQTPARLDAYAEIPAVFLVRSRMVVRDGRAAGGGIELDERPVATPWRKDYDAYADGGPTRWTRFGDLGTWGVLVAMEQREWIGGAVVAWKSPRVEMLEGRDDLAVLWDLRVRPLRRRYGVGRALGVAALDWARARGCTEMKVETQDVNVPACRLYAALGFGLAEARRGAYAELPHEVQLIWRQSLA